MPREFGPFRGKVVDTETGEPVEGAVVFIRFFIKVFGSPGGPVIKTANAVEVLTDKDGEFEIPRAKYQPGSFRFPARWLKKGAAIVFKPGYGAFPGHEGTSESYSKSERSHPENEYITIRLPKLKTIEERKKNLRNIYYSSQVPPKKQQLILELINIERKNIGFQEPIGIPTHRGL